MKRTVTAMLEFLRPYVARHFASTDDASVFTLSPAEEDRMEAIIASAPSPYARLTTVPLNACVPFRVLRSVALSVWAPPHVWLLPCAQHGVVRHCYGRLRVCVPHLCR